MSHMPCTRTLNKASLAASLMLATAGFVNSPIVSAESSGSPFLIAPMIEGFGHCKAGATEPNPELSLEVCRSRKDYGVADLGLALDALEPGGARGKVQVGYTYGINLLTLLDDKTTEVLVGLTRAIQEIDRPVVLYLFANHLATTYSRHVFEGAELAVFSDQTAPKENYFGGGFQPLSLDMDPTLKLNHVRASALKAVGQWYSHLPPTAKKKVAAITMAGELHHYFDDFTKGMGRFDNVRVTDYSPTAIEGFRRWLATKYRTIEGFNRAMGTNLRSFADVRPPSLDARKSPALERIAHFDSFAHGVLPVEGWLQALPKGQTIKVYLNGVDVGTAEYGLSRQDVYEAVPDAPSAKVGFRYGLDFSKLPPGRHALQVILEGDGRHDLGQRQFTVLGATQAVAGQQSSTLRTSPTKIRHSLDVPSNDLQVLYNPLARDWYAYRGHQVTAAYDAWFDLSVASGLPKEKLYSHQIAASLVGSWNALLFASDDSIKGQRRYKKGINLYGGAANMALIRKHYLNPGETFGVPEFHSQAWKDPTAPVNTLNELRSGGARFVTPYFLSMVPDRYRSKDNAHDKFRVAPENPAYGSNHLYQAIKKLALE